MTLFGESEIVALQDLAARWGSEKFVLIGAAALGFFLEMRWRRTYDLDFVLATSIEEYAASFSGAPGWTRDPQLEHRWRSSAGVMIDVIPLCPGSQDAGTIRWPESGRIMSLAGLRLAFAHAVRVDLAPDFIIAVAPPPVLAFLKMVAYLDRPGTRSHDLGDLAHLMEAYVPAHADDRYGDEILAAGLDWDEVSPYILGVRMAAILDESEHQISLRFMAKLLDENVSADLMTMTRSAPPSWRRPEGAELRVRALERGMKPVSVDLRCGEPPAGKMLLQTVLRRVGRVTHVQR